MLGGKDVVMFRKKFKKGELYMSSKIRKTKEMREFSPILSRNGFTYARANGSHFIYVNRKTGKHISVNKDLNKEVRSRLIKENCLV